jgi:HEAT repeat protein
MASRRTASGFDDKLARIAALADLPPASAAPELRRFLTDALGYLVGEAAKITAELELRDLVPDLAAAFTRLIAAPAASDKGCHGKNRLVEALLKLDADAPEVYLAGLRYVQREPAFGEPIDTAAPLRGLCAHALFQIDHRDAIFEVTPLLMDREPETRSEAAAALGNSGLEVCGALLHLKVLTGDREPDVLGACFKGLLRLAPRRYLPVVAAALASGQATAEAAAIALGESRLPEALPLLKQAIASAGASRLDEGLFLGLALLRSDDANAHLLSLIERAPEGRAAAAVNALALHRHDERLSAQVRAAVAARKSAKLQRTFEDRFGA